MIRLRPVALLCALGMMVATSAMAQIAIPNSPASPGIVVPASEFPHSIRIQLQSTGAAGGYACLSFMSSAISILTAGGSYYCSGPGAFLAQTGWVDQRIAPAPVPPASPLYGIASAGSTLQVAFEVLQ